MKSHVKILKYKLQLNNRWKMYTVYKSNVAFVKGSSLQKWPCFKWRFFILFKIIRLMSSLGQDRGSFLAEDFLWHTMINKVPSFEVYKQFESYQRGHSVFAPHKQFSFPHSAKIEALIAFQKSNVGFEPIGWRSWHPPKGAKIAGN